MEKQVWTPEYCGELFGKGFDCGQVVLSFFAEELGLTVDEANKLGAAFGGGCGQGGTCGAVAGAMMALGLKYGHFDETRPEQKEEMMKVREEFLSKFKEQRGSALCRDLLGHDISKPGEFEKVQEEGTMGTLCPALCSECIAIAKELL
ncbi:MAG: C_GCAxxG_C_C family protein [Clostridia bacterium]|nr:C_GCAxxG_C_C family protein [Clostridia bacterium]